MDGYRDLRLVLTALRAGRVDPARLAEVGLGWAPGATTPFWEYLVERGVVAPEPAAGAGQATTAYLPPPVGGEDTPSFAADGSTPSFSTPVHPTRETVAFPGAAGRSAATGPPTAAARYDVLRKHREGGLGEVWLARDGAVGREVALKRLRPDRADDPDLRARFVREARITGRLEHPCVVPLYDLIEDAGGRGPCYVMRFVAGRTLAEAVADYHAHRAKKQTGRLELAALLDAFVAVCRAVAYAHALGVLHRDLKGQNVVLGDFGEVFLLDWGLAKPVGEADAAPTPMLDPPVPAGPDQPTRAGSLVGTPAYMAPEVAAGGPAAKASDIYGLGAVLYAILTGKPPYQGLDPWEVVEKVKASDPPPPRAVNPDAPPALEAVCRKAMARDPAGRYGTADELATEVRRWLADEPLAAYRDPWTVRATRWARRHRTTVAAASVFLLTALVALAASTALVWQEERRTAEQKRIAEENFDAARGLSSALIDVAEKGLAPVPGSAPTRKDMLTLAIGVYEKFQAQRPDDADLQRRAAELHRYAANVHRLVADAGGAERSYRESVRLRRGLIGPGGGERIDREELSMTLVDYAEFLRTTGRRTAAAENLRQALDLAAELSQGRPPRPRHQRTLAFARLEQAAQSNETGRYAEAATAGREAADLLRGLLTAPPPDRYPYDPHLLGEALDQLARSLREQGQLDAAEQAHAEAVERLRAVDPKVGTDPDNTRQFLAACLLGQGRTWARDPAKRGKAEENFGEAIRLWEDLVRRQGQIAVYRMDLALGLQARAELLLDAGRPGPAVADLERSRELLKGLADQHPEQPRYVAHLGRTHLGLGRAARAAGKPAEAEAWFRNATAALRDALDRDPASESARRTLAEVEAEIGR